MRALEIMSREDINQLPVISAERLQGIFSRSSIMGLSAEPDRIAKTLKLEASTESGGLIACP
jgi:CBS domain-containing protein